MAHTSTLTSLFHQALRQHEKDIFTSIPGHIVAFDTSTQLAQVQIGIKMVYADESQHTQPVIIQVPIVFIGSDDYIIEHEINIGTEGAIFFSQRIMDDWKANGGIVENTMTRLHDMQDAFFLPGLRSQPNKLSPFHNDGIKLRNKDDTQYFWIKKDGNAEIKVNVLKIEGDIEHTGSQTTTGTIDATGDISSDADVKAGSISLNSHLHGGVSTGGSDTGVPK